jgi:hypothetical protein
MPGPYDPYRRPRHVGDESPASGEAKQQDASGPRGGPQEKRRDPQASKQPAQASGRRAARYQRRPAERKTFTRAENPARQGRGQPNLERIKQRSRLRGLGTHPPPHA